MTLRTRQFDPASYLGTEEARAVYMLDALATNDPAFITDALDVTSRARAIDTAKPLPDNPAQ
jgi:DNA-binding phage protein